MHEPMTVEEWRAALEKGVGLTPEEGIRLHGAGGIPVDRVEVFVREAYGEEDEPGPYVEAVVRNLLGMLDWVYGEGGEPYWPGCDTD
jgi:hypothetical protein